MATSLLRSSRAGNRKNLTCGVCRDVFRSPRFLPCHHTFCLYCLEGLARAASRGGSFPCPSCRKPAAIPAEGALGFQVNFYITEEELELERKGPATVMCGDHQSEVLSLFCVPCDRALCIFCKLTSHEGHHTRALTHVAAECQGRLSEVQGRLDETIAFLRQKRAEAGDSIQAAEVKAAMVEAQVAENKTALITKVSEMFDQLLVEARQSNEAVKGKLATGAHRIQQELDSLLQLRQRVHHAQTDAADAEKVEVEREMREGEGSEGRLEEAKRCVPTTSGVPSLTYDRRAVSDDAIRSFLGSPVQLSSPLPVREVVVPIFQCGQEGACREVHSVCHINEDKICISFGGTLPSYAGEDQISINDKGERHKVRPTSSSVQNKRITFCKHSEGIVTTEYPELLAKK